MLCCVTSSWSTLLRVPALTCTHCVRAAHAPHRTLTGKHVRRQLEEDLQLPKKQLDAQKELLEALIEEVCGTRSRRGGGGGGEGA